MEGSRVRARPGGTVKLTTFALAKGPLASSAFIIVGASDAYFGSIALPLDLTPFGATYNHLYVSMDLVVPIPVWWTGSGVSGTLSLPVPNTSSVVGLRFFAQAILPHAYSNPLGLVFSNGLRVIIGPPQPDGQSLMGDKGASSGRLPVFMTHLTTQLQAIVFN